MHGHVFIYEPAYKGNKHQKGTLLHTTLLPIVYQSPCPSLHLLCVPSAAGAFLTTYEGSWAQFFPWIARAAWANYTLPSSSVRRSLWPGRAQKRWSKACAQSHARPRRSMDPGGLASRSPVRPLADLSLGSRCFKYLTLM